LALHWVSSVRAFLTSCKGAGRRITGTTSDAQTSQHPSVLTPACSLWRCVTETNIDRGQAAVPLKRKGLILQFPNPTDALLNPVRYWADFYTMQVEFTRTTVDVALAMNPLLPEGDFAAFWTSIPPRAATATPSQKRVRRIDTKVVSATAPAKTPVPKKRAQRTVKPSPAVVEALKAETKPSKTTRAEPVSEQRRRPARKTVTLPPGPPPGKSAGEE
jgi:hypothetical protein